MIADILASAISLPFLVSLFRELPPDDEPSPTDQAYQAAVAAER